MIMKHRSYSLDKVLRRGMTVAGICLALMIVGKAVDMTEWKALEGHTNRSGKQKAAECLMEVWRFHYPAGKASAWQTHKDREAGQGQGGEEGGDGIGGDSISGMVAEWIGFLWAQSPVCRYLLAKEGDRAEYREADPSYETYRKTREFYQEHQYLAYYGDEESHEEQKAEEIPVEQEENQMLVSLPESEAVHTVQNSLPVIGTKYVMEQLVDYDFLMKHFYNVHTSTTATRGEMNAETLLGMDLSIQKDGSQPQILIYHTHSQETFADYSAQNPDATVVGIGNYLTELLQAKGYNVIHNTAVYDLKDGALDRSKAYTYALDGVTGILQENPSIQVVLDLHRDGVKEGLHLVSEVNGKRTAPIMFFNGMSQTSSGTIEYLQNPYKEENLAFSLQMQLDAAAYYPGLTRKIYLKGLRYNLHVRPRSALIEVGAQTNTYEEARNAMEPLAELLDMVLQGH